MNTDKHYTVEFEDNRNVQFKYRTFDEMINVLGTITSNHSYFKSNDFYFAFNESIEKWNSYAYIWNDSFGIEHCVSVFVKTFDKGNND